MQLSLVAFALFAFWPLAILGVDTRSFSQEEIDSGHALKRLVREALGNIKRENRDSGCRFADAQVRREWRELPETARKEFTDAIVCLQNIPTTLTADLMEIYPGVKTRYDEFLATHIQLTKFIHMTADFLAWHRFFIHALEQDLKSKCDYPGSLPYWEWGHDAEAPEDSSLFNGDPFSLGTNGIFIPNRDPLYWPAIQQYIPVGTGGGCMPYGPFSNYTVNMGPINSAGQQPVKYDFEYNPRCLARDLKRVVTEVSVTFRNSTELILSYDTIDWFQGIMQKDPRFPAPEVPYGVHRGGHVGVGPVMGDAAGSPADPMFWLHHAQLDRIWMTWQGLDPGERRNAIWGTHTLADVPPSANMTLDEMLDFVLIAKPVSYFRSFCSEGKVEPGLRQDAFLYADAAIQSSLGHHQLPERGYVRAAGASHNADKLPTYLHGFEGSVRVALTGVFTTFYARLIPRSDPEDDPAAVRKMRQSWEVVLF
ncbi:hypothetical protein BBP40_006925 [Aspergillus hancockii]|nr:hypothetical protein BBP40_006925 [Aspergillus hancockii]